MREFKPTPAMLRAARNVFVAMAYVETIRPVVEGYHQKILDDMKPLVDSRWPDAGQLITSDKRSYLMSDADFQEYFRRAKEERDKAGLKVENNDNCPLLVAEHLQCLAESNLIDTFEPVTRIKSEQLNVLEQRDKYIDLCLRLLAPFVGDSDSILNRYTGRR